MTTLCTLFGLLPLALGLGAGAELQKPLALAVIGGLSAVDAAGALRVARALLADATRRNGDCPRSASVLGESPSCGALRLGTVPNWLRSWGQSPLDRDADRAGHARAAQTAVAVRVLRQVLLVVRLGVVELGRRQNLGRDRAVPGSGQCLLERVARA